METFFQGFAAIGPHTRRGMPHAGKPPAKKTAGLLSGSAVYVPLVPIAPASRRLRPPLQATAAPGQRTPRQIDRLGIVHRERFERAERIAFRGAQRFDDRVDILLAKSELAHGFRHAHIHEKRLQLVDPVSPRLPPLRQLSSSGSRCRTRRAQAARKRLGSRARRSASRRA